MVNGCKLVIFNCTSSWIGPKVCSLAYIGLFIAPNNTSVIWPEVTKLPLLQDHLLKNSYRNSSEKLCAISIHYKDFINYWNSSTGNVCTLFYFLFGYISFQWYTINTWIWIHKDFNLLMDYYCFPYKRLVHYFMILYIYISKYRNYLEDCYYQNNYDTQIKQSYNT